MRITPDFTTNKEEKTEKTENNTTGNIFLLFIFIYLLLLALFLITFYVIVKNIIFIFRILGRIFR